MGQKVTFNVIDKSAQDNAKWQLYIFVIKLLNKEDWFYGRKSC